MFNRHEARHIAAMETLASEQVAAERQAAQLEAMRATARAVAHNLNQPLAIIRGYAELLGDERAPESVQADVGAIIGEVDRAARLVQRLLQVTEYQTVLDAAGTPLLDLVHTAPPNLAE
jgi:signal transduction histidine kinase